MSRRKGKTLSPVEEPKIIKKRLRNTKKVTYNKESDDDEDDQISQSVESMPIKKGTKKQTKAVAQSKSQPAKQQAKQNEKIKFIPKVCNQLDGAMKEPQDKCCSTCTNRDLIRAAKTRNLALFKTLLKNHSISNPNQFWSPDDQTNVLSILLSLNDKAFLAEYAKYIKEHKWGKDTKIYMSQNDTGYNRKSAYGAYTRRVTAGRKNREGNNAFLRDPEKNEYIEDNLIEACFRKHFDYSALQYFEAQQGIDRDGLLNFYGQVNHPIRKGNYKLAGQLIEQMQKQGVEFGFNQLHVDVLKQKPALGAYKSTSVTKKTNGSFNITPLHCAAINPDSKVLETLLSINNEPNIFDDLLRRPIHYAAACESSNPLQLLLSKGVDALQADKFKTTPFHIAAKEGRLHNLKILAKLSNVTAKNRSGYGAIHFAAQHGNLDCVKELVENHDQLEWPGPSKCTPLILAAQYGHYDIVEYLLEKKAKINKKDKFGKTALSQAVINGHLRVAAILIQKGADYELPDSSNNYPLHYAAAYGFYECLDILIQAGADVNVKNSWNLTPLSVALQKGHKVIVRRLLERNDIDVNCKDDSGKTLIVQEIIHHKEITEHLRYLIEVKKADVNITDLKGRAAIHYALASEDKIDQVQLLIDNGADINLSSEQGGSPFIIALLGQNFKGTQLLKRHPNFNLLAKDKDGKNILSQLIAKDAFYDAEYGCSIILEIAREFPREALEACNNEGFNIMHELLIEFYTTANAFSQVLLKKKIKQFLQSQYIALREQKIKKKKQELILAGKSKKKGRRGKKADMQVEESEENNEDDDNDDENVDDDNDDENGDNESKEVSEDDNVPKRKTVSSKPFLTRKSRPAIKSKPKPKSKKPVKQKSLADDKDEDSPFEIEKDVNESDGQKDDELNKGHMTITSVNTQQVEKEKSQKSDSSVQMLSEASAESEEDEIDNPIQQQRKKYKEDVNSILMMLWYKGDRYYFRDVVNEKYTPFELSDFIVPYNIVTNSQYKNYKKEITPKLSDVKQLVQEVIAYVELVEQKVYNIAKVLNCEVQIKGKYQLEHYQYAYYPKNIEKSKVLDHLKRTPFHFLATYAQSSMLYDLKEIVRKNLPIEDSPDLNGDTIYGQLALRGIHYDHVNVCNNFNQVPLFEWIKVKQVHKDLLDKADPNFTDKDGRNALHFAVMFNDQETLHHLLQKGVNQCQQDKYGRTPLFYAFIQNNQLLYKDKYEPFELVSYLLKDVNQIDSYGRTCLHYAAQRGSSMSARQIISKGAQINIVDKFGNTPLGTAFWANHSEFCTMLIDNHAEIHHQVNQINQKALIADCVGLQKSNPLKYYKKRSFRWEFEKGFTGVDYVDYREDFIDESKLIFRDDDQSKLTEMAQVVERFYKRDIIKPSLEEDKNNNKNKKRNKYNHYSDSDEEEEQNSDDEQTKKKQQEELNQDSELQTSYYYAAQQKGWNQVAYILITNGYSMIQALEDTFRLKKFEFIIYLLMRAEKSDLTKRNDKNQNIYHYLAKYSNHQVNKDYIEKIIKYLQDVDFNAKDVYQQTPLHFACQNVCLPLISWLLQQGADPNSKDQFNNSPFAYLLQKQEHKKIDLQQWKSYGYDISQDIYIDGLQTGTLIYLVRHKRAQNVNFIKYYLEHGVDINQKDSNGQTLLHAAIYINSTKIVSLILESNQFQQNMHIDQDGRTPIHHVVMPLEFGSYENTQILQLLLKFYDPLQKDNRGLTPFDYACQFESSELRQILKKYQPEPTQIIRRAPTSILNEKQWGQTVDFMTDAHEYLKDQVKQQKYEVDFTIQGNQYSVYGEYSVLMTKVDVYSGYYSQNVFYKMQVLHEKVRDVYILLTRWGRIGDRGQHQHTPFQKVEDCLKEFVSVYKQKTGNEWGAPYQKKNKKYHILKQKQFRNTVKHLKPFDQTVKSELEKDIHEVIQNFAQVQLYQDFLKKNNIKDDTLESLDKEDLEAAENIINEIEKVSKQLEQVRKDGVTDLEQYKKLVDEIAELSNRFYEHLPEVDRQDQHVEALSDPNKIHEKSNLVRTLQIFETASKIILAAVSKQHIINPIQYCFQALNIKMIQLKKEDIEYKMIERYMRGYKKISRAFSVERKHEVENFKKFDHRMLLWHGTRTYNYLGILSNGLKIAPYKVGRHGNLFGNGIYFADFLEKSYAYCHGDENITNKLYVLLCEVSLGKVQEFKHQESKNIEFERSNKFNSVMCAGAKSPDFKQNVILSNGCKVPIGDEIKVKDCMLGFNEYIVYNENQVRIRYIIEI